MNFSSFLIGVVVTLMFGSFIAIWRRSGKDLPVAESRFTEDQELCIRKAASLYREMKVSAVNHPHTPFRPSRLNHCFWQMIIANFRSVAEVIGDSPLGPGLRIYQVVLQLEEMKTSTLLPALEQIIRCDDPAIKSALVCQYRDILAASLFDSSDQSMRLDVLCAVLDAVELSETEQRAVRENQAAYLQPLGFERQENSQGVVWSQPRRLRAVA
jgi:hypothetical protein